MRLGFKMLYKNDENINIGGFLFLGGCNKKYGHSQYFTYFL